MPENSQRRCQLESAGKTVEKQQGNSWKKGKDPHPKNKSQHLDFTKDPRPLYYKTPPCVFHHKDVRRKAIFRPLVKTGRFLSKAEILGVGVFAPLPKTAESLKKQLFDWFGCLASCLSAFFPHAVCWRTFPGAHWHLSPLLSGSFQGQAFGASLGGSQGLWK